MSTSHTSLKFVEREILQFRDGTQIVDQRQFIKTFEGYKFTTGYRFEDIATDAEVNIILRVPAGSGRMVFFIAFEVSSFAQAHIDIYFDVNHSGGNLLEILNLRRDKQGVVNSVAEVLHSVSYTPSEHHIPLVHSGGTKQFAVGGLSELSGGAILASGNNILIVVTNKSASSQDISLRLVWWEDIL